MAAKLLKPKVMYCEWMDACAHAGWSDPNECDLHPVASIGFLVKDTEDCIVLSSCLAGGEVNGTIAIPKAWIVNRKFIKV